MTASAQLYELQVIDLHIDNLGQQLADIEAGLKDDRELVGARGQVEKLQAGVKGIRPQYHEAELKAQDLFSKVGEAEKRLYGGDVRNPRELQNLEDDLKQLRRNQGTAEDRQLELMGQLEEAEKTLTSAEARFAKVEVVWNHAQRSLGEEHTQLAAELVVAKARREQAAPAIDPRHLVLYNRLRSTRGDLAVALLERGACQGCRLVLPTGEISKVRSSTTPVQCTSCARILYLE